MILDVSLTVTKPTVVYESTIADDPSVVTEDAEKYRKMAIAVGIYQELWKPKEIGVTKAAELIRPLEIGLDKLATNRKEFKATYSPDGWGPFENFLCFVRDYLQACRKNPEAEVTVSR